MPKKTIKKPKKDAQKWAMRAIEVEKGHILPEQRREYARMEVDEMFYKEGINPLLRLGQVGEGGGLTEDHPYLPEFIMKMEEWDETLKEGGKITREDIAELVKEVKHQLTDSWITHEIRMKALIEAAKYHKPQLQRVEARSESISVNLDITPQKITKKDATTIKRIINEE